MAIAARPRRPRVALHMGLGGLESAAAFAACLVAAVYFSARLLRPDVVSDDALVHQYWMLQFLDGKLFQDPLTDSLRDSARYPHGYVALFWVATHLLGDPIGFGEWLGVFLWAACGWLVWRIVRDQAAWKPGAWIAAALFMSLVDIQRFYGGFSRAFVHPVVLLTVLLAMRGRRRAAAAVAFAGVLVYPPAAALAAGTLVVAGVLRRDRRACAVGGGALVAAAGFVLLSGSGTDVFTRTEARAYPEFGPNGPLHFFANSAYEYFAQNRSGFDLRTSGSILAVAALALLLVRRRGLRPEVHAMAITALGGYVLAQIVLFRLYLPHRFTYPLIAYFAIVVGVMLEPAWRAFWGSRVRNAALLVSPLAAAAVAVWVFPLGPLDAPHRSALVIAAGAVVAVIVAARFVSSPGIAAALAGLVLIGTILVIPDPLPRGSKCPKSPVSRYLNRLPKDSIVAGDPYQLKCIVDTAKRPVVISSQLSPAYEKPYFLQGRQRMFDSLRAYYGPSERALDVLVERYGATHLMVRRDALEAGGRRYKPGQKPYGAFVRGLLRSGRDPAVLHLPAACRTWQRGPVEVYDLRCVTRRKPTVSSPSTAPTSSPASTS